MANVKISALPSTTATTFNDWLVKNDSGETTTSRVQLKNTLAIQPSGTRSIKTADFLTQVPSEAPFNNGLAFGDGVLANGDNCIAVGFDIKSPPAPRNNYTAFGSDIDIAQGSICIGKTVNCESDRGISIGNDSKVNSDFGIALGTEALCNNYHPGQIAIGYDAENNADYTIGIGYATRLNNNFGVGIGYQASVNHDQAVVLGSGMTSVYSATTHVNGLHTLAQTTTRVQSVVSGITFSINADDGGKSQLYLTGSSLIDIVNVKDGSSFLIKTQTDGGHTITWSASGYTFLFAGGTSNPGNNKIDLFRFEVFGSVIYGERISDFS
jgi:hypothetical protein